MSWLSNLFGGGNHSNPANAAMPYLNQMPGMTMPYMSPFFNAGAGALNPLQEQYGKLLNDPGGFVNKIGEGYKESPGFKSSMERALMAGNHAAAAGGMAGTPADQFNQMKMATDLSNQDYNNYLSNALSQYGLGLQGQAGLAGMGQQSGQNMADMIANMLSAQAGYGFAGKAAQNQRQSGWLENLFGGMGAFPGIYSAYKHLGEF